MSSKKILFFLLLLGFLLRIWAVNWGLPYLYHTDEYRVVNFALKMAATKSLNPGSFIYPTFYLYITLIVYVVTFFIGKIFGIYKTPVDFAIQFLRNPSLIYIITRSMSAVFGTLIIYVTYLLAKKIYNERTAIFSAGFVAILPSFVEYSHYAKIEMFSTFLVVLLVLFLYEFYLSGQIKYFYFSCILLGVATSTKYIPIVCIFVLLFVAVTKKLDIKKVLLGLFLIAIFFFLCSPYAILDFNTFYRDVFMGHIYGERMKRNILKNFWIVLKSYFCLGEKIDGVAIIGTAGIIFALIRCSFKEKFLLLVIFGYFLINIFHYYTSWYFMANSFPIVCILAGRFVDEIMLKNRFLVGILILFIAHSFYKSLILNISFCLEDTRTEAVKWIERNIPYGSKVLIDMYAYSPQIKMTKTQLEKLYKKASELNHYKKQYLYYQILSHPGGDYGYEVYQVWRPFYEVTTTKHEVEEAEKLKELVDVSGGVEYIKKLGVQYVIINSFNYNGYPLSFYKELQNKYTPIKKFVPKNKFQPGPTIEIYSLY